MDILSLFDGMSCGRIALDRAGIKVTNYFASEIDKYAIKVSQHNWNDVTHIGDVTKVSFVNGTLKTEIGDFKIERIDLVIAGSPCQGFSMAGKQLAFDDERSKLYFEFERILKEIQAENSEVKFLLENVKMKQEYKDVISDRLGVQPIAINSNLVSAQNRYRLYWTNIQGIQQPKDLGIVLTDILIDKESLPDDIVISVAGVEYMNNEVADGRTHWQFLHHSDTFDDKSRCITAVISKGVPYNVLIDRRGNKCSMYDCDFQDDVDVCNNCNECDSFQSKYIATKTIRKFHPIEIERLQTVPDNYTCCVSNTQRYKMLGNGWTVDVISHIFLNLGRS